MMIFMGCSPRHKRGRNRIIPVFCFRSAQSGKRKKSLTFNNEGWKVRLFFYVFWRRPIFPGSSPPSIVGATGFHDRVRDGNGWDTNAMTTRNRCALPNYLHERAKVSAPAFTGERLLARTLTASAHRQNLFTTERSSRQDNLRCPAGKNRSVCRMRVVCVCTAMYGLYGADTTLSVLLNLVCCVVAAHEPYSCAVLSFFLSARLCPCLLPHRTRLFVASCLRFLPLLFLSLLQRG